MKLYALLFALAMPVATQTLKPALPTIAPATIHAVTGTPHWALAAAETKPAKTGPVLPDAFVQRFYKAGFDLNGAQLTFNQAQKDLDTAKQAWQQVLGEFTAICGPDAQPFMDPTTHEPSCQLKTAPAQPAAPAKEPAKPAAK